MKRDLTRVIVLAVIALVLGIVFNAFHKPGLPLLALNGEEVLPADRETVNGENGHTITPLTITTQQAWEFYNAGEALFLDARICSDWADARIPGALNIPLEELESLEPYLPSLTAPGYIIYCEGDPCLLSTDLAYMLAEEGFTDIFIYHEGLAFWREAGYPVERSDTDEPE